MCVSRYLKFGTIQGGLRRCLVAQNVNKSLGRIPPGVATIDFQYPQCRHIVWDCDTKGNSSQKSKGKQSIALLLLAY